MNDEQTVELRRKILSAISARENPGEPLHISGDYSQKEIASVVEQLYKEGKIIPHSCGSKVPVPDGFDTDSLDQEQLAVLFEGGSLLKTHNLDRLLEEEEEIFEKISVEDFVKEVGNESVLPTQTLFKLTEPYRVQEVSYSEKRDLNVLGMAWDRDTAGEIKVYGVSTYYQAGASAVIFLTPESSIWDKSWRASSAIPWMLAWLDRGFLKRLLEEPVEISNDVEKFSR